MKRVRLDPPHGQSATEILAALNVSLASGLSDHEAEQRLSVYGANAIGSRQKVGLISVLVHQLKSLVVALLAVAAAVAFNFREWEEGGAIVGVLILNTAIGFVTEIKAVRSIEAIRALGSRFGPGAPRRANALDSGRATGSGRHCLARCRRCYFGGPAGCGNRRS